MSDIVCSSFKKENLFVDFLQKIEGTNDEHAN